MQTLKRLKVLLASYYDRDVIAEPLNALRSFADVTDADRGRCLTREELMSYLPRCHITIGADEKYSEEVLDKAPELVLIARDGTGFDGVDVDAATERGIIVTRAPVVHCATANLTIGLMISLVRKITLCDREIRNNQWTDRRRWLCPDLTGMTLGIVGFGQVGREVAKRALAMGMDVLAYDMRNVSFSATQMGVTSLSRDELLRSSDIVTVHMNATKENAGMFNADLLSIMKRGAYFMNCSRGSVVDEQALLGALTSGHLAGAALDVFSQEPPPPDNPLFSLENVICTPHVAGDTTTTMKAAIQTNVAQIRDILFGKKPEFCLNIDVWDNARIHSLIQSED